MTIGERIRKVRRELDLTQTEFAAQIGSVQNSITGYENGRRNPSQPIISLICNKFNVNELWLRTGEGEMFAPSPSSALDALAEERGLSHRDYILIEKFLTLKPEIRSELIEFLLQVAAAINSGEIAEGDLAFPGSQQSDALNADDLHAELERQIALEKGPGGESEVS